MAYSGNVRVLTYQERSLPHRRDRRAHEAPRHSLRAAKRAVFEAPNPWSEAVTPSNSSKSGGIHCNAAS
jgi:hypothetical protein